MSEKPARMKSDPEGYDAVHVPDGEYPCFSCALCNESELCGKAPCIKEQRPDQVAIKYVKREGEQQHAR